jgi:hypothetical protein
MKLFIIILNGVFKVYLSKRTILKLNQKSVWKLFYPLFVKHFWCFINSICTVYCFICQEKLHSKFEHFLGFIIFFKILCFSAKSFTKVLICMKFPVRLNITIYQKQLGRLKIIKGKNSNKILNSGIFSTMKSLKMRSLIVTNVWTIVNLLRTFPIEWKIKINIFLLAN